MFDKAAQKQRFMELLKQFADECSEFFNYDGKAGVEQVADYILANGVIVLPCHIGDTVYIVGGKYHGGRFEKWINTGKFRLSDLEKIGKTIFLTREEAESALEVYCDI